MEKVNLKDIDLNLSFFHFTDTRNLNSIAKEGLVPKTGGASILAGEEFERVYFSKGAKGLLSTKNLFINTFRYTPLNKIPDEYREFFPIGTRFDSNEFPTPIQVYEAFLAKMKTETYIVIDAQEGVDYLEDEVDFADNEDCIGIVNGVKNHSISPEKLRILVCDEGETAFDIVSKLMEKIMDIAVKMDLEGEVKLVLESLWSFFDYLKYHRKQYQTKLAPEEPEF